MLYPDVTTDIPVVLTFSHVIQFSIILFTDRWLSMVAMLSMSSHWTPTIGSPPASNMRDSSVVNGLSPLVDLMIDINSQ